MVKVKEEWPKLPPKFKAKWLAALRSGEYKQGVETLYTNDDKYCCLGVACRVAKISTRNLDHHTIPEDFKGVPKILRGMPIGNTVVEHLTKLNDGYFGYLSNGSIKKRTFKGIATWIDKNL